MYKQATFCLIYIYIYIDIYTDLLIVTTKYQFCIKKVYNSSPEFSFSVLKIQQYLHQIRVQMKFDSSFYRKKTVVILMVENQNFS
jgi:hypothetical protein